MSTAADKDVYSQNIAVAREKRDVLPLDSPIRHALSDHVLKELNRKVREKPRIDLEYDKWPPVFAFVASKPIELIEELDDDLRLVIQHTPVGKVKGITQFLATKADKRLGDWYGGLFDVWAKATAIRSGALLELDSQLANRRDHDVRLEVNGRPFHIENTVITRDDESQEVWDRYVEYSKVNPKKALIRPGPFCPPNAKGPSPYYLPLRLYAKVYDKLTKNLDPDKSQFTDDEPNVLFLSFAGPEVDPDDPGVGWVLDELFADQPRPARAVLPESLTDISLDAWVEFRANELVDRDRMTLDWYCEHWNRIMAAPRQLSAILLFDGCRLAGARVNYNANEDCSITHSEIAELEELFSNASPYWM